MSILFNSLLQFFLVKRFCFYVGFCVVFCCFVQHFNIIYAQNNKIDSLKKVLRILREDTNKVNTAVELAYILEDTRPDTSLFIAKDALEIAQKKAFTLGILKSLFRIGYAYQALGRNDKAWEYYEKHLVISENQRDTLRIGRSYYALGYLCKVLNKYPQSFEYFKKCVFYYDKINDQKGLVRGYNSLGTLATDLQMHQEAKNYFEKSLKIAQNTNDARGQAFALKNLGEVDFNAKNYENAKAKWEYALTFVKSPANVLPRTEIMFFLAKYYHTQNQPQQAIILLKKILEERNCKDVKVLHEVEKALQLYGEILQYENPKQAYQYEVTSRNLKDSLQKAEKIQELISLSMNFEAEAQQKKLQELKNQKENDLLQQGYFFGMVIVVLVSMFVILAYRYNVRRTTQKQTLKYNQELLLLNAQKENLNTELIAFNNHLEDKIHERTLTLEDLNAKLAHYAFINAHKLRSPVATILGLLQLIKEANIQDVIPLISMLEITVQKLNTVTFEIQKIVEESEFISQYDKENYEK